LAWILLFLMSRGREIGNAAPEHQSRSGALFDRGAQLVDRSRKSDCCVKISSRIWRRLSRLRAADDNTNEHSVKRQGSSPGQQTT
jgi:hypothetical protein